MRLSLADRYDTGIRRLVKIVFAGSSSHLMIAADSGSNVWEVDWQNKNARRRYRPGPAGTLRLLGGARKDESGDGDTERPLHEVRAIIPSPEGDRVIDNDPARSETWLVDLHAGQRQLIARGRQAYKAACSMPPHIFALGGNSTISLLSWPQRRLLGELAGHRDGVRDMAFSPDGSLLVSVGIESEDEKHRDAARLWDLRTFSERQSWMWHHLGSVAFHPGGKIIAVGCTAPAMIKLWNAASGAIERDVDTAVLEWVSVLSFTADGRYLCAGTHGGLLWMYEVGDD